VLDLAQIEDSDVLEISAKEKEREKEREQHEKDLDYDYYLDPPGENNHGDIKGEGRTINDFPCSNGLKIIWFSPWQMNTIPIQGGILKLT
jgi:hypothetical protein